MPTSATPRIQGGRPPSIAPVPCSTADAIIAPNIQLAGNLATRSSSAIAMAAAASTPSSSGEAIRLATSIGAVDAIPASASSSGSAAVRMITRMVCTTAIAGDIGALLGGQHGDLRQRAGASRQQRRGLVPAVEALQIKTRAEGRAEGRQRQQADGQGIGAHVLDQLPRHQRAQRDAEQHQHGLRQHRRHGDRPPAERGDADGDHRAGDQPARQVDPQEQQAAGHCP